ncbi:CARDB domain-containing protein [Patescibacteria group bacterium]
MKKLLLYSFLIIATAILVVTSYNFIEAQGTEVFGWAWSSHIGWINFNCADTEGLCDVLDPDYKVEIVGDNLIGYAWSSSIGWIDFDPAGPYPELPNNSAQIEPDDTLSGWARVVSFEGGDDGWIKMSGIADDASDYGVSKPSGSDNFQGFAWGGIAIGWIKFCDSASPSFCVSTDPDNTGGDGDGDGGYPTGENPDLISDITSPSPSVEVGTPITFTGTVYNVGNSSSASTEALFILNDIDVIGEDTDVSGLDGYGGAYASEPLEMDDSWVAVEGEHTIRVCAKYVSSEIWLITDLSHINADWVNCSDTASFVVTAVEPPAEGFDLKPTVSNYSQIGHDPIVFQGEVTNLGADPVAETFNVVFKIDGAFLGSHEISTGLESKAKLFLDSAQWTPPDGPGEYSLELCIDPSLGEDNNPANDCSSAVVSISDPGVETIECKPYFQPELVEIYLKFEVIGGVGPFEWASQGGDSIIDEIVDGKTYYVRYYDIGDYDITVTDQSSDAVDICTAHIIDDEDHPL